MVKIIDKVEETYDEVWDKLTREERVTIQNQMDDGYSFIGYVLSRYDFTFEELEYTLQTDTWTAGAEEAIRAHIRDKLLGLWKE